MLIWRIISRKCKTLRRIWTSFKDRTICSNMISIEQIPASASLGLSTKRVNKKTEDHSNAWTTQESPIRNTMNKNCYSFSTKWTFWRDSTFNFRINLKNRWRMSLKMKGTKGNLNLLTRCLALKKIAKKQWKDS